LSAENLGESVADEEDSANGGFLRRTVNKKYDRGAYLIITDLGVTRHGGCDPGHDHDDARRGAHV
jgi:hypothetical protein